MKNIKVDHYTKTSLHSTQFQDHIGDINSMKINKIMLDHDIYLYLFAICYITNPVTYQNYDNIFLNQTVDVTHNIKCWSPARRTMIKQL